MWRMGGSEWLPWIMWCSAIIRSRTASTLEGLWEEARSTGWAHLRSPPQTPSSVPTLCAPPDDNA